MKVAYILHDTDMFGGANRSFLLALYTLIKRGIEPLVVVPNKTGIYNKLQEVQINTLVLNYRPNTFPYEECVKDYLLWIPRLVARRIVNYYAIRKLVKQIEDCDLVHTNVSVIDIGARAAKKCSIPHVYHFREYADLDFHMRYFPSKKRFYQSVTHAICITQGVLTHHHLSCDTRVIYNAILNEDTQQKQPLTDSEPYLLYAGRLEETKGIEDLLKAYSVSDKSIPLWIAGSALKDQYLRFLQHQCQYLGIAEYVHFLGNRTDILQLMASARAVIIPSYHEAFGRIMAEAMHQHCLTIARNTSGLREQLDNGLHLTGGEIGLRFNTTAELTAHIDTIAATSLDYWSAYKDRAYQTVRQLYTTEACAEALLNYYNSIILEK